MLSKIHIKVNQNILSFRLTTYIVNTSARLEEVLVKNDVANSTSPYIQSPCGAEFNTLVRNSMVGRFFNYIFNWNRPMDKLHVF